MQGVLELIAFAEHVNLCLKSKIASGLLFKKLWDCHAIHHHPAVRDPLFLDLLHRFDVLLSPTPQVNHCVDFAVTGEGSNPG